MATQISRHVKFLIAALALASAACTVSSTDVPSLTGPSELALSFFVSASPDSITQDGHSQSLITVSARDENGQPKAGVIFRLDMLVAGVPADYGTLSGKTVVTGSDGKATAAYTAPNPVAAGGDPGSCRPSIFSPALPGTCVTIAASPIGSGFTNNPTSQQVDVHLVPIGVIRPPADIPTAAFVVTPEPVNTNVATNFDGSPSCGGSATAGVCNPTNNVIVSYSWGFGDGGSANGKAVQHAYSAPGTYTVILTVTNDGGKSASASKTVTVAASAAPGADFTFSPSAPGIGQIIHFNASASKAAPGRTLVSFAWNFGDGIPGNGQFFDHAYTAAANYQVTLTVTDDAGQSQTTTKGVTVNNGNPTAVLAITKAGGLNINADGSSSTAVSGTITTYTFTWGDPSADTIGASPTAPHTYAAAGTYTVRLTVTDSSLRSGSTTQTVTVP